MQPNPTLVGLTLLALALSLSAQRPDECSTAVVARAGSACGAPLLWKNRDTGKLSNKVLYVADEPYSYIGLANADVPSGRHVFAGLNSVGFGVINTVAYNLPKKAGELVDLEGIIMADALRLCRTVADFERYLRDNLGPSLGSWANFGAIDADGGAFLFEVHNHGVEKHDVTEAPAAHMVNTNFARTGRPGGGAGYLRFERASELFAAFTPGKVDFATVLTRHTRDIGHVLLEQPTLDDARRTPASQDLWVHTSDCINRPSTASAVVIVGRTAEPGSVATMWVIPGEPLAAVAVPLWVEAGRVPESFWKGEDAPMWQESLRLKAIARPHTEGNKNDYVNLTKLDNANGTGFLPGLLQVEQEILAATHVFLQEGHAAADYAAFQDAMATRALKALRSVR